MAECLDAKPRNIFGVEFARNWISAETYIRSLRRRLIAILRMAYRVLGMRRKGLGLGALGVGKALAVAVGAMSITVVPQVASAQNYSAGGGSAAGSNAVAIGTSSQASATGGDPVALGDGAKAVVTGTGGSPIAIGTNANASGAAPTGFTFEAVAIGNGDGDVRVTANSCRHLRGCAETRIAMSKYATV
jgi:hypothetical protein